MQRLLSDVFVLDVSRVLAGPLCAQLLGDLGARVVKIERPGSGDETRHWGPPFHDGVSSYFRACNRNKESVCLDLGREEGKELFGRLAERADILIENFRPSSAKSLGLDPDELARRYPRLIVVSISGYGQDGPWSGRPGYDFAVQAVSGLMALTGPTEGPSSKVCVAITDVLTALYAANAAQAALHARERTGKGQRIEVSLLASALAGQVNLLQSFLDTGHEPTRQGNAHLQIVPYQTFRAADGADFVLCVGNDGQWRKFCEIAGAMHLADDERFATNAARVERRDELIPQLERLMATKSSDEWETLLTGAGIPCAVVGGYGDLWRRGGEAYLPTPGSGGLIPPPFRCATSASADLEPPRLGADTDRVLSELCDVAPERLEALRADRII